MGCIEARQDKQKQSEAKDKKENYQKYGLYLSTLIKQKNISKLFLIAGTFLVYIHMRDTDNNM